MTGNASRPRRRRGLSTLEMVLSLPILLFIMALMINFGTAACWKIRALSVARHAVWGSRWPRTGFNNPRPKYWPDTAHSAAHEAGEVPELDDPRVDLPVARGPLPAATVKEDMLDPTRGLRRGSADITREFPLLAKMGEYEMDARTHLLDDKWQYQRMGLPRNVHRRIPVIYALAKAPAGVANAYVQAAMAILGTAFRDQLAPLDRDDEFIYYSLLFGWGSGPPDFHPRLQRFCTLDPDVANQRKEHLIARIEGKVIRDAEGNVRRRIPSVAERMTEAFIGLYRRVIREYRNRGTVGAEIPALEQKISTLTEFLQVLRGQQNEDGD